MNAQTEISADHRPVPLRVEDFILLWESGAFNDYGKTELIEGEILCMNSQLSRHARMKSRLAFELAQALRGLGTDLETMIEVSTQVSDFSLPEPDIVITDYKGDRQVPLDTVKLIVEVADTTLSFDMGRKKRLYARAEVPEYWVVDVEGGLITQMWDAQDEDFRSSRSIKIGEPVEMVTLPALTIQTAALG